MKTLTEKLVELKRDVRAGEGTAAGYYRTGKMEQAEAAAKWVEGKLRTINRLEAEATEEIDWNLIETLVG